MSVLQDLRFGARMLRKSPGITAIAVVTLALGIGANTAAVSTILTFLYAPLPFDEPDHLVALSGLDETLGVETGLSLPDVEELALECPSIESAGAFQNRQLVVEYETGPETVKGVAISPEFLAVLRVAPVVGRGFVAEDTLPERPAVAVIGQSLWRRRFGSDPTVIGRTLRIDRQQVTIVGVVPERLQFPSRRIDVWLPLSRSGFYSNSDGRALGCVARLVGRADVASLRSEVEVVTTRFRESDPAASSLRITASRLDEIVVAKARERLLMMQAAVAFVLMIACANVANLLLARASSRAREVAIRTAVGAGRGRIVRQFLAESLMLSFAGGALGLPVARWLLDFIVSVGPAKIADLQDVRLDGRALAATLAISIVTGIAFGLAPALKASATETLDVLKRGGLTAASGRGRLRSALVALEVALSLVLLVGAGLVARAYLRLETVDPGFDATSGLAIDLALPESMYPTREDTAAYFVAAVGAIRSMSGVEHVGAVDIMPLVGWNPGIRFEAEGRPTEAGSVADRADLQPIIPGYIEAIGIPVRSGRTLADSDLDVDAPVALVNDRLARKLWPGEEAVGKRIRLDDGAPGESWRAVVGVIGDVRQFGVQEEPRPEIYVPGVRRSMTIVVRTSQPPGALAEPVIERLRALDPSLPRPAVRTLEAVVADALAVKRLTATSTGVLAIVALLLSSIGIYGVIADSVARRTREIGVRMALGARPQDVTRLVVLQSLSVVGVGIAAGLVGALGVTRFLRSMLFGVSPFDPITFVAACVGLGAVAFLAAWIPARRSSRVDPMTALRHE